MDSYLSFMLNPIKIVLICFSLTFANVASAQTALLSSVPETKAEFAATEKNFIASVDWLENTPLNENEAKRKEQNTYILAWLINSPTVTLEIQTEVIKFSEKNSDLLLIHMGGWGKYALQNNYSKDNIQGNLAGLRSCIKVYNANKLNKDKFMLKLIWLDEKGKLEQWIKDQLPTK